MSDRYKGKPFLVLLEKYVLLVIKELKPSDLETLEKMTPNLQKTFKQDGTWSELVAAQMDLTAEDVEAIDRNWVENKKRAQDQGKIADPQIFAQLIADRLAGSSA